MSFRNTIIRFTLLWAFNFAWGANGATLAEGELVQSHEVVKEIYMDVLGRPPDSKALEFFVPILAQGERDAQWLRKVLKSSPEGHARQRRLNAMHEEQRERMRRAPGVIAGISAIWLGMFALFAIVGRGFVEWAAKDMPWGNLGPDLFQFAWIGMGTMVAIIQIWSLIWPVNGVLLGLSILGGMTLGRIVFMRQMCTIWIWCKSRFLRNTAQPARSQGGCISRRLAVWLVIGGIMGASLVAIGASAQPKIKAYDTLLYHLNAVHWANEYAAVPGLANLHMPLGIHSAWLLLAAWVDHGILDGRAAWVMPGFARLFFLGYLIHVAMLSRTTGHAARIMALLLIPYGIRGLSEGPTLYYDAPAMYCLAAAYIEFLRWYDGRQTAHGRDRKLDPVAALCIGFPAAVSVAIKPIGSLACLGMIMLMAWGFGTAWRQAGHFKLRVAFAYGSPVLILVGWLARNAVLSGWLLFPAPIGRLPVDWAVPFQTDSAAYGEQMHTMKGGMDILQAWARHPGSNEYQAAMGVSICEWGPGWYARRRNSLELRWLFPAGLIGWGVMMGIGLVRKTLTGLAVAGPGIIFAMLIQWFLVAPDLRFGSGLFWIGFAVCWGLAASQLRWCMKEELTWTVASLASLALIWPGLKGMPASIKQSHWMLGRATRAAVTPIAVNKQSPPLVVYVPQKGDQCGDSPLPSTPYPSGRLMARNPGCLAQGFWRKSEGDVRK